ncbi:hypothetical protein V6255_12000 [Psychromonas arctica]|uniref:Uncharacterized protein n=1 Tax=Psychromonas arctica TaxID=168275 RepID=A0ABU9HDI8_9GAMM
MSKDEQVEAMLVQKHQLKSSEHKLSELDNALNLLSSSQDSNLDTLESMLSDMDRLLGQHGFEFADSEENCISLELEEYCSVSIDDITPITPEISALSEIDFNRGMDWQEYSNAVRGYASSNDINLSVDPFNELMSPIQRINFEKRIKSEFSLKNAQCDKYDYMIAGTCGLIGGLIDVFFVGLPGEGKLTKFTDDAVDGAVETFAKVCGWKEGREGSDPTASAIGFLERNFKVNYDHRHGVDVDGLFNMSTKNHHIKNLGHSPDLIGLFFSILGQFTNTAHFVDGGKVISVDTENFELKGANFVAKIFSGFVNWLGHLFSDVAGSSGATGRGSGIPIPFFSLFQFMDFGEFGQHRQTFAQVAVQVFEKGYDFRHGLAMAIPVMITELLTRLMWVVKQRGYHNKPWKDCIPTASNPELRRMLFVAHGSLCLIDGSDAALRSGGDMVQFLLRTNLIGWVRFGHLGLKEVYVWYNSGHIDADAVDEFLDAEYEKMLKL